MIFQYNPIDYYVETNEDGELVFTLCRTRNAAPKIRYNIRDLGHVVRFPELRAALDVESIALDDLARRRSDLPLLFLYGRADDAVAYFGCKITPGTSRTSSSRSRSSETVDSFALVVTEDEPANKRLAIAFELRPGVAAGSRRRGAPGARAGPPRRAESGLPGGARFMPAAALPTVEWHAHGTGPFAGDDIRLKKHYVRRGRLTAENVRRETKKPLVPWRCGRVWRNSGRRAVPELRPLVPECRVDRDRAVGDDGVDDVLAFRRIDRARRVHDRPTRPCPLNRSPKELVLELGQGLARQRRSGRAARTPSPEHGASTSARS